MTTARSTLDQLLDAVRHATGRAETEWAHPPVPLTGGFWAEMWRVALAGPDELTQPLVARVMPDAAVGARETAVQDSLARSGYPTPAVRLSAPPGPHLDAAWMLMDHASGDPLLSSLSGARAIVELPRIARTIPERLAHHAASLHRVDPAMLEDALDLPPLIDRLRDQAATIVRPDLEQVANRLRDRRPGGGRAVICHGDLHPFNILSHPHGDTVLDWSAAAITDPAHDIAFTRLLLKRPPLPAPRLVQPVIAGAGRALAHRFVSTYNRVAHQPVDPPLLEWFTDVHALRILTEVGTWYAEGVRDHHADHPFNSLVPRLAAGLSARTGVAVMSFP